MVKVAFLLWKPSTCHLHILSTTDLTTFSQWLTYQLQLQVHASALYSEVQPAAMNATWIALLISFALVSLSLALLSCFPLGFSLASMGFSLSPSLEDVSKIASCHYRGNRWKQHFEAPHSNWVSGTITLLHKLVQLGQVHEAHLQRYIPYPTGPDRDSSKDSEGDSSSSDSPSLRQFPPEIKCLEHQEVN